MFDCKEEFSKEQLEKIKRIIQIDSFREINDIVNICDLDQDEENIIKNVKDYIWSYLAQVRDGQFFTSVNTFISFIENYYNFKEPNFTLPSNDGDLFDPKYDLLWICNGYHIYGDYRYSKNSNTHGHGFYMLGSYLGCNHKIYLARNSMRSRQWPVSLEIAKEVDYNPLLAESFFNYFSQPVASYYLLRNKSKPFNEILTPFFLKDNQELIHLQDLYIEDGNNFMDTHTNRLNLLKDNLALRYKEKMDADSFQILIEKIQLQYCIQSFMKLLIGPMDINFGNTAIVLTHENNSNIPSIDISPAYDLDISFRIADELMINNKLEQVCDANGNSSTIMSLVAEFKDIPGFKEFLEDVVKKISSHDIPKEVLDDVYRRTNLEFFKEKRESYILFLEKRFIEVLHAYQNVFLANKEDEIVWRR